MPGGNDFYALTGLERLLRKELSGAKAVFDVLFNVNQPTLYTDIDKAAMAAALEVYRASADGKNGGEGGWKLEYGMAIFGNKADFRESTEFCLGQIRKGQKDNNDGTEQSNSMKEDMEKPTKGYWFNGTVHSHPAFSSLVRNNEFSSADYYLSLSGYTSVLPFNMYLVINVGASGTLIKFSPPPNTPANDELFEKEINQVIHDVEKHSLPISERNKREHLIEHGGIVFNKNVLLNKIIMSPARYMTIKAVAKIVSACNGKLVETPIKKLSTYDNNLAWEALDPATILWKSGATTLTVEMVGTNREVMASGEHNVENVSRGRRRSSMYDLRKTITTVNIKDGVDIIGIDEFIGFEALKSVVIQGNRLKIIADSAFSGCTNLMSITIPSGSLKGIGACAFYECINLMSITVQSDNIEKIGERAFFGCTNLASIDIQSSHQRKQWVILDDAFYNCTNLTNVNIRSISNVASIGERAFCGCSRLTSVVISNLKKIGEDAFAECERLESITCLSPDPPQLGSRAFTGTHKNLCLRVPEKYKKVYTDYYNRHYNGRQKKIEIKAL